jgi:transposase
MDGIVAGIFRPDKRRLHRRCRKCKDGKLKTRYLIILNLADGRSVMDTARALKVDRSTVYRVAARFREQGEDGLVDGRVDNGGSKLNDEYLSVLWEAVASCPL